MFCGPPASAGLTRFTAKEVANLTFGVTPTALLSLVQASSKSVPSFLSSPLPLLFLFILIFYFLMIRPAQTRQKKVTDMLKNLKNGDKVVTNGGIYGTIVGLEDDSIQLRVAEQVKIKVARNAIAGLQPESKES
jgi:preprotein translocase subunit YajC